MTKAAGDCIQYLRTLLTDPSNLSVHKLIFHFRSMFCPTSQESMMWWYRLFQLRPFSAVCRSSLPTSHLSLAHTQQIPPACSLYVRASHANIGAWIGVYLLIPKGSQSKPYKPRWTTFLAAPSGTQLPLSQSNRCKRCNSMSNFQKGSHPKILTLMTFVVYSHRSSSNRSTIHKL